MGQLTAVKPSRSDEVLDANEQALITEQVKAKFDSMAPKRPAKPCRSEPESPSPASYFSGANLPPPEFEKLRSLQSQSQGIISGSNTAADEFVETQYYQQLDSIDKQHHTTGSGFIKVAGGGAGDGYGLRVESGGHENGDRREAVFRTNPATNDWVPAMEDDQIGYVSGKPSRSESD
ncbi:uncharacterized protein LOC127809474 [Diospyros lotus]|uniref:uncharacterized protein LOC127809474 n=1 Tax=Diospyros lotus TaxID=55363 RepID=UPI00225188C1|nr:uncharacterized protein LOC127809474 [Diospyros lotus]